MEEQLRLKVGNRISKNTIIANFVLAIIKVSIGIISKSNAMMADGVHTLSDIISTIVVMIGLKFSTQPEDKEHPYGHEKFEPVVSKILSSLLLITGLGIGYTGLKLVFSGEINIPSRIAIYAALLSVAVKEWMYRYTVKGAEKIDSAALKADAWHHRSDALSSIGTLIGIAGARLGFPILDPIAAVVVSVLIIKVAIEIYLQAVNQLIDKSADKEVIEKISSKILSVDGVINIDELKTRVHANKLYVDVEISVNANLSVYEGHEIAENVHLQIEKMGMKVKHCMVHVNPL